MSFNWTCPYCDRDQVVTDNNARLNSDHISVAEHDKGDIGFVLMSIVCANKLCKKIAITLRLFNNIQSKATGQWSRNGLPILVSEILLQGSARPQPDYIPESIREDYKEACLIKKLSPKASATLARRCLQGMIRDFGQISRKALNQEIIDLRAEVLAGSASRQISAESVEAINNICSVGNIGAHMESDINYVVPVDADEAQLLIDLIETLFAEWYVERHNRTVRFAAIGEMAAEKKAAIAAGKDGASAQAGVAEEATRPAP